MKEIALRCDCIGGEHYILVSAFVEQYDTELYFDVITDTSKFTIWKKLGLCWRLLSGRNVSEDCVLLNEDKAKQLISFIGDYLQEINKETTMENLNSVCPVCRIRNINLLADMCDACDKECCKDDDSN